MINVFQGISEKSKEKILNSIDSNCAVFNKGDSILLNRNRENSLAIIEYGYLQFIKNEYNGEKTVLEEMFTNSIFSLNINNYLNSGFDIIALENTKIIFMDFNQLLITDNVVSSGDMNRFFKNIIIINEENATKRNERIEILTKKTIRNKLLAFFKINSTKYGTKIIYLPSSFTNLSLYLAVDRSAMSREIKNLKDEGLIAVKGKKITLLY